MPFAGEIQVKLSSWIPHLTTAHYLRMCKWEKIPKVTVKPTIPTTLCSGTVHNAWHTGFTRLTIAANKNRVPFTNYLLHAWKQTLQVRNIASVFITWANNTNRKVASPVASASTRPHDNWHCRVRHSPVWMSKHGLIKHSWSIGECCFFQSLHGEYRIQSSKARASPYLRVATITQP